MKFPRALALSLLLALALAAPASASAATLYFYSASDTDWANAASWYTDAGHTTPAGHAPTGADAAVVASGSVAPLADLDTWTAPASIDSGTVGVSFASQNDNGLSVDVTGNATFNSGWNFAAISGNATFNNGSINSGATVSGNATFNGYSTNFGTVTGDATFNASSNNYDTVTGDATFNGDSQNNGGTVSGDATFNGISVNGGTVSGNATFTFYSNNSDTVSGDATFRDGSYNNNSGTVNGNAAFHDQSYNQGTVTGCATFLDSSTNNGTVQGGTCPIPPLYFYSTSDPDWGNLANWYTDVGHTTSASSLPDVDTPVVVAAGSVAPLADLDAWTAPASIDAGTSGVGFTSAGSAQLTVSVTGDATFFGDAYDEGAVSGDATFNDDSFLSYSGTVAGDAHFHTAHYGALPTGGVFTVGNGMGWDGAVAGTVYGDDGQAITRWVFLGGGTYNEGTVPGDAAFYGNSASYAEGTVTGNATFYDISENDGTVTGGAEFRGISANYGTVRGDACFGSNATDNGVVRGDTSACPVVPRYFYSESDPDWGNADSWYADAGHATPAGALPDSAAAVTVLTGSVAPLADLDAWTAPDSIDAGTSGVGFTSQGGAGVDLAVTGDASFYGASYNDNTVTGNAAFHDQSYNQGTVTGCATFLDDSYDNGSVGTCPTPATLYFYSDSDPDWANVASWFLDVGHTTPAGVLPDGGTSVFVVEGSATPLADLDTWTEPASIDAGTSGVGFTSQNYSSLAIDVTGDATFYDYSINAGTVSGDATFSGDQSANNGTVSGDAAFYNSSYNDTGGTVTGDATFSDISINYGHVTGTATFAYATGGVATIGYDWGAGTAGSIVGADQQPITRWVFTDGSSNSGTVTGDAEFYDSGPETGGNLGTVTGNASFYGYSYNQGTVLGDACFGPNAQNQGTVNGSETACPVPPLYFYSDSDPDWGNLASWYTDAGHTAPASRLPDNDNPVVVAESSVAPLADLDSWTQPASIDAGTVGVGFTSHNGNPSSVAVTGGAYFYDQSYNQGTVDGTATFSDSSYNDGGGTVLGDAAFHGNSYNAGAVTGTAIFQGGSGNDGGTVSGDAFFYDTSYSNGTVSGNAYFYGACVLNEDDPENPYYAGSCNTGTVGGNAQFRGGSANVGDVEGDACFGVSATNSGTVGGQVTVCDETAPSVSLTSPLDGATVSGAAVALAADASDDTGVTGVRFAVDGVATGTEDTSAPYELTWDSTAVADGSHTVSAVARDAAGNYATSTATVTVANAPAGGGHPAPAVTTVRHPSSGGSSPAPRPVTTTPPAAPATSTPAAPVPPSTAPSLPPAPAFLRNLQLRDLGQDVRALQAFLNGHGAPVSASGPGAPGQETTYFGLRTLRALARFQAARGISPAAGFFGPITRGVVSGMLGL